MPARRDARRARLAPSRAMKSDKPAIATPENPDTFDVVEDALFKLWGVVNDLSKIKPPARAAYRVTIFGSARTKPEDPQYAEVRTLAERLTEMGCEIVTGGGPGLMQAANEGADRADPEKKLASIGIRVELPFEQHANPFVEQVYTHRTFFTRLMHFVRLSDAFIVVRGGVGTTLETLMIWQLLQVRHAHDVPLVLVGDMWADLLAWGRKHMLTPDGLALLANPDDLTIPECVGSVDEALAVVQAHRKKRFPG